MISIVAVFLALSLGLLVGTTVLPDRLVEQLRANNDALQQRYSDAQREISGLRAGYQQLLSASDVSALEANRLNGVRVVVLSQAGLESDVLPKVRDALDKSGAQLVAAFTATVRLGARGSADRTELATILAMPPNATPAQLQAQTAQVLAARLADGAARPSGQAPTDVLEQLLDANFLAIPPGAPNISKATLPEVGGRGQVIVVLGGGAGSPVVPTESFLLPVVNTLLQRNAIVAAGESTSTEYQFVGAVRSDGAHGAIPMVTVDDVDLPPGGLALVLGIERLLTLGEGGDYGVKSGAKSSIPPPP